MLVTLRRGGNDGAAVILAYRNDGVAVIPPTGMTETTAPQIFRLS